MDKEILDLIQKNKIELVKFSPNLKQYRILGAGDTSYIVTQDLKSQDKYTVTDSMGKAVPVTDKAHIFNMVRGTLAARIQDEKMATADKRASNSFMGGAFNTSLTDIKR